MNKLLSVFYARYFTIAMIAIYLTARQSFEFIGPAVA